MMFPQSRLVLACSILCVIFEASTVQTARVIPRPALRTRRSAPNSSPATKFVVMLGAFCSFVLVCFTFSTNCFFVFWERIEHKKIPRFLAMRELIDHESLMPDSESDSFM